MRRFLLQIAMVLAAAAMLADPAGAKVIELGQTTTKIAAPTCPANGSCKPILTESTAYVTARDGVKYTMTVKREGYIDGFTLGLLKIPGNAAAAKNTVHGLDSTYGGTTQAAVVVLAPVGKAAENNWKLVAASPVVHLQPYLGTVSQFPLVTALHVVRGEVVALSVPTWAPVLAAAPGSGADGFTYRQNRTSGCAKASTTNVAMLQPDAQSMFGCAYTGTAMEFSATEMTTPKAPKNQIHAPVIERRIGASIW